MSASRQASAPPAPKEQLPAPPPWLCALQGEVGALLSTPPALRQGRLEVPPASAQLLAALAPAQVSAAAQLKIYQEQCWMRFFQSAQEQHRYTLRAIGPWAMNQFAMLSLRQFPPRGRDLGALFAPLNTALKSALWRLLSALPESPKDPSGAPPSLRRLVALIPPSLPLKALRPRCPAPLRDDPWVGALLKRPTPLGLFDQALRFDEAVHRAFSAPAPQSWAPSAEALQQLSRQRLILSPSLQLLKESWLALAVGQKESPAEELTLQRRHPPRLWVSWRSAEGPALAQLSPSAAALIEGSRRAPLRTLCAQLPRRRLPPLDEEALEALVQRGVRRGWWIGAADPPHSEAS